MIIFRDKTKNKSIAHTINNPLFVTMDNKSRLTELRKRIHDKHKNRIIKKYLKIFINILQEYILQNYI